MPVTRRFLIAPSLTRLIRKERGSERVTEGHFAPQSDRQAHVRLENGRSCLVLTSLDAGPDSIEDRTELPTTHAEALLEVCPGTVVFERSPLRLSDREALVERFVTPGPLDLVSVQFADQGDAAAYLPPVWFGSEITHDDSFANRTMALSGLPSAPETPLSNAALEAVLDILEGHIGTVSLDQDERKREEVADEDSTFDMLRRLAVVTPLESSEAEATPAEEMPSSVPERERKSRRPVLQVAPSRQENGDERLAGVIEGLSEALSQSTSETDGRSAADLRAQPGWRWSAH